MNTDFERERRWWDAKAGKEEQDMADEKVNRALRWREIERRLDGVRTILEVGAATGAFSIPLARRGYEVTHVDFSPAMLDLARQKAVGLENIRFIEANAIDLSQFADRSFDLVLNMDGAISFCGSEAERALFESCRVARKMLVVTVSHRACMIPVWAQASLLTIGRIAPAVEAMVARGAWHQDEYPENPTLTKGTTLDYLGALHAFLPGELRDLVAQAGMRVLLCHGLGTLAQLVGREAVERAAQDPAVFEQFLDLCERYDADILPDGPGTRQRAGLIAVAQRA